MAQNDSARALIAERAIRKAQKKNREIVQRTAVDKVLIKLADHNTKSKLGPKLPDFLKGVDRKYHNLIGGFLTEKLANCSFGTACDYLVAQQGAWIRDAKDWCPTSHNARRALGSLTRHLFAKYPTPAWLEGLYDAPLYDVSMELYPHVAQGGNIKDFFAVQNKRRNWPELTKKQSHILLNTDDRMPLVEATRLAQVLSFGGTKRQADALNGSFLGRSFILSEDFWSTVIQWLAANPFIAPNEIGPMMDYVRFCRNQRADFSMKGRTGARLYADMQEWHAGLQRAKVKRGTGHYNPSGFAEMTFDAISSGQPVKWCVVELLSQAKLVKEGSALRHCVSSYSWQIENAKISIWSLRKAHADAITEAKDGHNHPPVITIEVQNDLRKVVQVRGWANRAPTVEEWRPVQQWANQNGLVIGSRW